ncbi:MAG TPA: hypothetical protein VLH75_14890 [Longimicrobiales bacterium]|nr:hypothetical protein [Longimicrobiales bacterium]
MVVEARVVGIAGTAKNTGKTTALNALVAAAHARGILVAATSIGYDGETVDHVTGLPKPRIVLPPGAVATTADSCVPAAGWEVLASTGSWTALGEVVVVRCLESGPIVLAGPNRRTELARVVDQVQALGPALTLVDGALNRLAPMSVASAFVLATGAARTPDIPALARESAAMESFFRLPTRLHDGAGTPTVIHTPFPTADELVEATAGEEGAPVEFSFLLPVHPDVIVKVTHDRRLLGRVAAVTFYDPVLPLLCGDAVAMAAALRRCRERGVEVTVDHPLPLAAVTVNPFLPRAEGQGYVADGVSADALLGAFRASLRTPVVDVVAEGPEALWEALGREALPS